MNNGLILALYPKAQIAKDVNVPITQPSAIEFTIGHNVNSKAAVDAVMEQVRKAGQKLTLRATVHGVATLDISKTQTGICGRLSGIHS